MTPKPALTDLSVLAAPLEFRGLREFQERISPHLSFAASYEDGIREQSEVRAYCLFCGTLTTMVVDPGIRFGPDRPNLREGLICGCGAMNRDRLMLLATREPLRASGATAFFGSSGRWARWARQTYPQTIFCEHLGEEVGRGASTALFDFVVRNEDLTRLTFGDMSLDLIVHSDVLEHVADLPAVYAETLRVLRPGARMIFTAPFFHAIEETLVRARFQDGRRIDLLPPEIHGDPLVPEGIIAFYNFGWSLVREMRDAGFADVVVKMAYAPHLGIVSNGCPTPTGNMLPVYIEARKPERPWIKQVALDVRNRLRELVASSRRAARDV